MMLLPWEKCSPPKWENWRLKFAAPLKTDRDHEGIETFNYLGMENVESWTGKLIQTSPNNESNIDFFQSTGIAFNEKTVLFGKLRPYLAKVYIPEYSGICSTEFLVLNPIPRFRQRYLFYVLLTKEFIAAVNASTFGSKMPRANWDFIGSLNVPIPPLCEQDRIVDYLDRETAEIDALVAEKERMLALLEEKRQALISRVSARKKSP